MCAFVPCTLAVFFSVWQHEFEGTVPYLDGQSVCLLDSAFHSAALDLLSAFFTLRLPFTIYFFSPLELAISAALDAAIQSR